MVGFVCKKVAISKPPSANLDACDVFVMVFGLRKGLKSMARVPKSLGKAGRGLWAAMLDTYEFTSAEESLLMQACQAADEASRAREVLEKEGFTITAGNKQIQHPCCLTLRDARNFIARVMKQLEPRRASQRERRPDSWGLGVSGRG
jgi:hypothetical protein